jgi:hypothetical protein
MAGRPGRSKVADITGMSVAPGEDCALQPEGRRRALHVRCWNNSHKIEPTICDSLGSPQLGCVSAPMRLVFATNPHQARNSDEITASLGRGNHRRAPGVLPSTNGQYLSGYFPLKCAPSDTIHLKISR